MSTDLELRRALTRIAHENSPLRRYIVPMLRTAEYVSPVQGDRKDLDLEQVGSKYFHISNSGITFAVLNKDGGPVITVNGSSFGIQMAGVEMPTSREDTRELGLMFLESSCDSSLHNRYDYSTQAGDWRTPGDNQEMIEVGTAEISGDAHRKFMKDTVRMMAESLCALVDDSRGAFDGSGPAIKTDPKGGKKALLAMVHDAVDAAWEKLQAKHEREMAKYESKTVSGD